MHQNQAVWRVDVVYIIKSISIWKQNLKIDKKWGEMIKYQNVQKTKTDRHPNVTHRHQKSIAYLSSLYSLLVMTEDFFVCVLAVWVSCTYKHVWYLLFLALCPEDYDSVDWERCSWTINITLNNNILRCNIRCIRNVWVGFICIKLFLTLLWRSPKIAFIPYFTFLIKIPIIVIIMIIIIVITYRHPG